MAASEDLSSSLSSSSSSHKNDINQAHEYYEELDNQTLDFRKPKAPTPIPTKSFVKAPSPVVEVDPVQKFNEQLNRQFRPDLVPPSPSPPPPISPEPIIERTPSPEPIIFDSRAKPIKSPKKKKEPLVNIKQKLFNSIHKLTESTSKSTPVSKLQMSNQQTTVDGFQVPPGMMLVPVPQQQQSIRRVSESSQQLQTYPTVLQYKPPAVAYNNSFKNNKVAPPPSDHNIQTINHSGPYNSFQTPSSMMSTNHLLQSSYGLKQQQQQQQQNLFKHIDQSKSNKKKQKRQSVDNQSNTKNTNRSFALYNQKHGRIEGIVKNRLNIATDNADESRIVDDETQPKGKWALWLSQPLCLGLTRLSGGILFGSMIILGCASFAGLIASIVLYNQDSVTDAQWKILGMVVCAIMLITIIITLLIFIFCYKQGYMFDKDDDIDPNDPSTTQDAEGNGRQKAVLRKIYKFNRPNDSSSMPHHVSTSPPPPRLQPSVQVNDKQTNTDATIATIRPKDFDRGVWPSINAYGGISYRPLIPPQMASRFIQVFPHEIEESMQPQQIIYQVVAPASAIPPQQIQPRYIQLPAQPAPIVEYIETIQKQQPRTIQIPAPQAPVVEYIETTKKQPRTIHVSTQQAPTVELIETTKKQPRTIQVPAPQAPVVEYIETTQKQPRTIQIPAPQSPIVEYIETTQKQPRTTIVRQPPKQQYMVQPTTRYEYVDVEEQERGRRIVQQPQYEIVEEVIDRSGSSQDEEFIEIVDAPRHARRREKKKEKKHGFGNVSVKHMKSGNE